MYKAPMPILHANILKGRTKQQKQDMVQNVTKAICDSLDVPASKVRIIINEMEPDNYAAAGELVSNNN